MNLTAPWRRRLICPGCGGKKSFEARQCLACAKIGYGLFWRQRIAFRLRELGWTYRQIGQTLGGVSAQMGMFLVRRGAEMQRSILPQIVP